jgi:uncharacterized protein
VVGIHREHYGRGATRSAHRDGGRLHHLLSEDIYTPVERTLIDAGRFDTVQATRSAFQDTMRDKFANAVEQLTGRTVVGFLLRCTSIRISLSIRSSLKAHTEPANPLRRTLSSVPPSGKLRPIIRSDASLSKRQAGHGGEMGQALEALYAGDVEAAERLLPLEDQLSIFEAAAFGRKGRLTEILANDPTQVNAESQDGFRPLHLAVFGRQEDAVRLLIEAGAEVDAMSSGEIARVRPLGTAAFVSSAALARVLLEAGADPNAAGDGGFTPLHTAARNGDEELVRVLLEHGADPTYEAADGTRPVDLAASAVVAILKLATRHGGGTRLT